METKDSFDNIPPIRPDWDQPNYDENAVAPFTLEDPLCFADGTPLRSKDEWPRRRKEILDIFAHEMYGVEPPPPDVLITDLVDEKQDALAGFVVRSQYKMWFRADRTGPCINWIVFRPRYAKRPVPVIIGLNYRGNFELVPDPDIPVMEKWYGGGEPGLVENGRVLESIRGRRCDPNCRSVFPIGMIIARGYAVMSASYCEVSPDPEHNEKNLEHQQNPFAYTGVFDLWGKRDENRTDNTTALGAWAWALSRGLDLAERIPEIDATRSVVSGCSRLGKAALLAAARDERFTVAVPNQCGGGGACLAKRDYGECIGTEMRMFTHWYCKAYGKYAKNPVKTLTFDQHLLLASIAPRHLLIEGFDSSPWMDTYGEYLACRAASPTWEFLGLPGMPGKDYPDNYCLDAVGPYLGYVRRSEAHGISAYDWTWMLDFADQAFNK